MHVSSLVYFDRCTWKHDISAAQPTPSCRLNMHESFISEKCYSQHSHLTREGWPYAWGKACMHTHISSHAYDAGGRALPGFSCMWVCCACVCVRVCMPLLWHSGFNACMPCVYVHLRTCNTFVACTCIHETPHMHMLNAKHLPAQVEITAKVHAKRYHIVKRKEELLWCLQAYVNTSHRPARSFHQTYAQEICPIDVVRNTRAQNMAQHSFSNHVDHIRRQTHGRMTSFSVRTGTYTHASTQTHIHTHTPWAMMNAYTCLIESSKTTLSLSQRVCACVSS